MWNTNLIFAKQSVDYDIKTAYKYPKGMGAGQGFDVGYEFVRASAIFKIYSYFMQQPKSIFIWKSAC